MPNGSHSTGYEAGIDEDRCKRIINRELIPLKKRIEELEKIVFDLLKFKARVEKDGS